MSDNIIDLACLEEYTDGDPEAMNELIEAFFEASQESVNELSATIVDGQSDEWSAASHKLKGASAYVGADVLKSLCAHAQDMKVATQQERAAMFEKLMAAYGDVCEVLKKKFP